MHHASQGAPGKRRLVSELVGEAGFVIPVGPAVLVAPRIPDVHCPVFVLIGRGVLGETHRGTRQVDSGRIQLCE